MTSGNEGSQKICPFMSHPTSYPNGIGLLSLILGRSERKTHYPDLMNDFVPCQGEKCSAWIEPCEIYMEDIHEQGKCMQECPAFERDCEISRPCCAGYCALIFPLRRYT